MNEGIRKFYAGIWGSYERVNTLMTLGLDRGWRKKAVLWALESCGAPDRCLDVCTGTGQTAFYLRRRLPPRTLVIGADFSPPMIRAAADYRDKQGIPAVHFTLGDALELPFPDNSFDILTISFATRNLDARSGHMQRAFREFHRVLKPGGCFFNLETSQPTSRLIRFFFHLWIKLTVKPLGRWITGSAESYGYLASSIQGFYHADELTARLREAGFCSVDFRRLLLGGVALHRAVK